MPRPARETAPGLGVSIVVSVRFDRQIEDAVSAFDATVSACAKTWLTIDKCKHRSADDPARYQGLRDFRGSRSTGVMGYR